MKFNAVCDSLHNNTIPLRFWLHYKVISSVYQSPVLAMICITMIYPKWSYLRKDQGVIHLGGRNYGDEEHLFHGSRSAKEIKLKLLCGK